MLQVHFLRLLSYLVGMLFRTVLVALYRSHALAAFSVFDSVARCYFRFACQATVSNGPTPTVRFPATNDAVIAHRNENGRLADNSLFASLGQSMKLLHVRALNRDN